MKKHIHITCVSDQSGGQALYVNDKLHSSDDSHFRLCDLAELPQVAAGKPFTFSQRDIEAGLKSWPETISELDNLLLAS